LARRAGLLQRRARRQARLVVAVGALEQEATALGPHALAAAAGAHRLAAPARLNPIGAAGFLRRKPPVELDRRLREIPPQIILVARHPPPPCRWSDRIQLRRSYGDRHEHRAGGERETYAYAGILRCVVWRGFDCCDAAGRARRPE